MKARTWRGPFEKDLAQVDELGFEGVLYQVRLIDRVAEALGHPRRLVELLDPISTRAVIVHFGDVTIRAPLATLIQWHELAPAAVIHKLSVIRFGFDPDLALSPPPEWASPDLAIQIADRIRLRVSGLRMYDRANPVIAKFIRHSKRLARRVARRA